MRHPPVVIGAQQFVDTLLAHGCRLVSSVPCSYFAGPLRLLEEGRGPRHVPAANEGAALAIAAGAQLAGDRAVVLAQNSGFGNLINPLTSLLLPYGIPVVVFMSMRGWPRDPPDEPQHRAMGGVVEPWLHSLGIRYVALTNARTALDDLTDDLERAWCQQEPLFVLVARDAIESSECDARPPRRSDAPTREDVIRALLEEIGDSYVCSTTGYLSRTLFDVADRDRNFYMQGSMGHVAGLVLGIAVTRPRQRIVALDGDGSVLMHLGTLATIGHVAPPNLLHVVFDNSGYESTGGQMSGAEKTDIGAVAQSCGYRHVTTVAAVRDIRPAVRAALDSDGPAIVVVQGNVGGRVAPRPSHAMPLHRVATRFAQRLAC